MLQATPISALPEEAAQSGSLFINLSNFANSRDNNRQGTLDLLNLNASISQMDIDGDANNGPDLDVSRVYFVGHSLGGINGIPFVSINNEIAGGGVNASLPEIKQQRYSIVVEVLPSCWRTPPIPTSVHLQFSQGSRKPPMESLSRVLLHLNLTLAYFKGYWTPRIQ